MSGQLKQIFVCYSSENLAWVEEIVSWCDGLEVEWLQDRKIIQIGDNFREVLDAAMKNALASICLISPDFFESDYVSNVEIPELLKKKNSVNDFLIIPIIVARYDGFHSCILRDLQTLNPPDQHLEKKGVDLNFYKKKLRKIIEDIKPIDGDSTSTLSVPIPVSTLPAKPRWFVGYEAEKERLINHILNSLGLIAITGDPRTGRRTLAKQVAHELLDNGNLTGGAIWIDCQKIQDERSLIYAISEVYLKSRAPADVSHCQLILEDEFSKKRCLLVLENTENPRADFFERWARKIPSPSVVIDVTALFAIPEDAPYIHLKGLDDNNAEDLFIKVTSETLRTENPFSRYAEIENVKKICRETRNNPLLIGLYAKKCGQGLLLEDILTLAHSNRNTDTLSIWKSQLEPLFSGLEEDYRGAFLQLCRMPGGVSRELVREITGIESIVLGPAIKKQFLWDLGYGRYVIDPSVRMFAETKLTRPTVEIDREVALAFARVATSKATLIEQSLVKDRQTLDEAVEWFRAEWENLKYCVSVAERIGDKETVCRLADSILQFMIRRGKYDDCLTLYKNALSLRNDNNPGRSKTLNDMAVCYQFKGRFLEARKCIMESIQLKQDLITNADDHVERCLLMYRLAQSWNTYGAINNLFGEELGGSRLDDTDLSDSANAFENAKQLCEQALEIAVSDSMRDDIEIERSQTLSNLGRCFTICGHQAIEPEEKKIFFRKALNALEESISIERPGDEREGQTYSRLGQLRFEQKVLPIAEMYFNKAIRIFQLASNTFELGIAHLGRGRVLAKKASPDIDGAKNDFKRAEELFAELHNRKNQFRALMELAQIGIAHVNSPEAEFYAMRAYDIADNTNREEVEILLGNLQS